VKTILIALAAFIAFAPIAALAQDQPAQNAQTTVQASSFVPDHVYIAAWQTSESGGY